MPPIGPLREDDGPACRVCGCTENNACVTLKPHPLSALAHEERYATRIACSWVETSGNDLPRNLCSACAGSAADMAETIDRGLHILLKHKGTNAGAMVVAMARAAKIRYEARLRYDAGQTISPLEAAAIGAVNMSNH